MSEPRRKFSLKNGKTLEYKNGKWYYDGKVRSTNNFTLIDIDGYRKSILPDGNLAVQDVDENGNPIQTTYIGGTTKQARDKFWKQAPIIRHAVDSIANEYGINPDVLRDRLNHEGYVDMLIRNNNNNYLIARENKINRNLNNGYAGLNSSHYGDSFNYFGLDDVATMIDNGEVKPINEDWATLTNINENGREVLTADGVNTLDNIGLTAATLKYFRDKAAKDFPNATRKFLDKAAGIYYNRGAKGGKKYLTK